MIQQTGPRIGHLDEEMRFRRECDEIHKSLRAWHGDPDDAATDWRLLRQARETVRIRWGRERYGAMRDEMYAGAARLALRRANGGTDGKSYRRSGDDFLNENGNPQRKGYRRSLRRRSARERPSAPQR